MPLLYTVLVGELEAGKGIYFRPNREIKSFSVFIGVQTHCVLSVKLMANDCTKCFRKGQWQIV